MKYLKYFSLIFLCVLSFYFSDKVILYVESISPIMQQINEVSASLKENPINATIDGNTIIPGKKGSVVNSRESYLKMNEFGVFNENFFVFDYINPDISLEDNKDKIIVGSSKLDNVALIVDTWKFESILKDYNYSFVLSDLSSYKENTNIEYLNGSFDNYDVINNYLKRKKKNTNIMLADYINVQTTKDHYIVSPSLNIYHSNLAANISKIKGGSIIYLHDNLSTSEVKLIMDKIKYKNLSVMKLSKFISE